MPKKIIATFEPVGGEYDYVIGDTWEGCFLFIEETFGSGSISFTDVQFYEATPIQVERVISEKSR